MALLMYVCIYIYIYICILFVCPLSTPRGTCVPLVLEGPLEIAPHDFDLDVRRIAESPMCRVRFHSASHVNGIQRAYVHQVPVGAFNVFQAQACELDTRSGSHGCLAVYLGFDGSRHDQGTASRWGIPFRHSCGGDDGWPGHVVREKRYWACIHPLGHVVSHISHASIRDTVRDLLRLKWKCEHHLK